MTRPAAPLLAAALAPLLAGAALAQGSAPYLDAPPPPDWLVPPPVSTPFARDGSQRALVEQETFLTPNPAFTGQGERFGEHLLPRNRGRGLAGPND